MNYFFIFFESSETYFDLFTDKIGAKLYLSSNFFVKKSARETWNENFVERKEKNQICFCMRFSTLRIFWDQKHNLVTFEMRVVN